MMKELMTLEEILIFSALYLQNGVWSFRPLNQSHYPPSLTYSHSIVDTSHWCGGHGYSYLPLINIQVFRNFAFSS
jgi:hypothetical protein